MEGEKEERIEKRIEGGAGKGINRRTLGPIKGNIEVGIERSTERSIEGEIEKGVECRIERGIEGVKGRIKEGIEG
jgi:hypothetical protein